LSAKFQIFADRGCHVVSVMDPYGRNLGFLDRSYTVTLNKTQYYHRNSSRLYSRRYCETRALLAIGFERHLIVCVFTNLARVQTSVRVLIRWMRTHLLFFYSMGVQVSFFASVDTINTSEKRLSLKCSSYLLVSYPRIPDSR
jgi:hypothetical protein